MKVLNNKHMTHGTVDNRINIYKQFSEDEWSSFASQNLTYSLRMYITT